MKKIILTVIHIFSGSGFFLVMGERGIVVFLTLFSSTQVLDSPN